MESIKPKGPNESLGGSEKNSRREFLKKLGLAGATVLVGGSLTENFMSSDEASANAPAETPPVPLKPEMPSAIEPKPEITVKEEKSLPKNPDEDLAVIETKDYAKFLSQPYLVSALYYSDKAIEEMIEAKEKTPQQVRIIEIYKYLTPALREGYIAYLDKLCEEKGLSAVQEFSPIKNVDMSNRLDTNHLDAIDLFTAEGSAVHSSTDGIVVLAENSWKESDILSTSSARGGNTVIIYNSKKKEFYRYAHLNNVGLQSGSIVHADDEIARVGATGLNASKPGHGRHLHFEINRYDSHSKKMLALSVYELRDRILAAKSNAA